MQQYSCVLHEKIRLTQDTNLYRFKVEHTLFSYIPGQFVSLTLPDPEKGGSIVRAYSIAGSQGGTCTEKSTITSTSFDLVIRHIPNGRGTGIIDSLPLGSQISSHVPMGMLTVDKAVSHPEPLVYMANATGIAPFRAMLQYWKLTATFRNITVFWGLKTTQDIYLAHEFSQYKDEWTQRGGVFRILYCLSQETSLPTTLPHEGMEIRLGRIQASFSLLTEKEYQFFLCGGKSFVLDTHSSLKQQFPTSSIYTERFN